MVFETRSVNFEEGTMVLSLIDGDGRNSVIVDTAACGNENPPPVEIDRVHIKRDHGFTVKCLQTVRRSVLTHISSRSSNCHLSEVSRCLRLRLIRRMDNMSRHWPLDGTGGSGRDGSFDEFLASLDNRRPLNRGLGDQRATARSAIDLSVDQPPYQASRMPLLQGLYSRQDGPTSDPPDLSWFNAFMPDVLFSAHYIS